MQLWRERSAQSDEAMGAQVFVEILATGQKRHRRAAKLKSARGQMSGGAAAGRIAILRDVEASNGRGQQQGGEMGRGESGGDRKGGHGGSQRERRLQAFARDQHVVGNAVAHGVAEEIAHGALGSFDGSFAEAVRIEAVGIEPGAMHAGDVMFEVGDGGDQGRPALPGRYVVGPVIAMGVEAKPLRRRCEKDAPPKEIGFGCASGKELRHSKEPSRGRLARHSARRRLGRAFDAGQVEEAAGFVGHVLKAMQTARLADDVEEIAKFAGRGVGPVARGAAAGLGALQADVKRAAGRVADVAHKPVGAMAAAVGEIVAANGFGAFGEPLGEVGSERGHQTASFSLTRSSG